MPSSTSHHRSHTQIFPFLTTVQWDPNLSFNSCENIKTSQLFSIVCLVGGCIKFQWQIVFYTEVAKELPMDLLIVFQNLLHHTTSHDMVQINYKAVSLSLKCCLPGSATGKFQVYHANGCGFTSYLVVGSRLMLS